MTLLPRAKLLRPALHRAGPAQDQSDSGSGLGHNLHLYVRLARIDNLPPALAGILSGAILAWDNRSATPEILSLCLGLLALVFLNSAANVLNQCYDRTSDALNKPKRPLPSRAITGKRALQIATLFYMLAISFSLAVPSRSWFGIPEFFAITLLISLATWIYSVPPFRTKRYAWSAQGTIAIARGLLLYLLGFSCVASVFLSLEPWYLGGVLSLYLLGASATKDFSDVAGDRIDGCRTLPILHGPRGACLRLVPFFLLPWLLLPLGVACTISGQPILTGNPVVLFGLGLVLFLYGCWIARYRLLTSDPTPGDNGNHPSWRHAYRMMVLAHVGIVCASLWR